MTSLAFALRLVEIVLVTIGCFFLTVGTIGLIRLPDVYNRLHATTKSTTLGAASIFLAGAVHFGPFGPDIPSLVGIVFLFITAPTGAHMISRSARKMDVPFFNVEDGKNGKGERER